MNVNSKSWASCWARSASTRQSEMSVPSLMMPFSLGPMTLNLEISWNGGSPSSHPCRTMGFSLTKTSQLLGYFMVSPFPGNPLILAQHCLMFELPPDAVELGSRGILRRCRLPAESWPCRGDQQGQQIQGTIWIIWVFVIILYSYNPLSLYIYLYLKLQQSFFEAYGYLYSYFKSVFICRRRWIYNMLIVSWSCGFPSVPCTTCTNLWVEVLEN